ncbi:hypothetical protein EDD16DRAFT_1705921 [Pisolithus croceorrhizus]|nr:hypothetical protein EDD16DRAFT_1705921 [Pisolithus croceorrhizus]
MLLRSLVCFPKLLVTIGKQCSSTVLHLLRYVLSLWNASVQKWKRKDLMQDNAGDKSPLRLPSIGGEKDRTVDARVGSATTLCSEDEGSTSTSGGIPDASTPAEGGVSNLQPVVPSSVNANPVEFNSGDYPSLQTLTRQMLPFANPFARVFQSDLVTMLLSLDYPNFIGRSLQSTRVDNETDLDRWNDFWNVFQANIGNISLLINHGDCDATVLLSGNLSFLSIVAQDGLSYLPQRLSYASLFAALGSIFVGLAVRTPRFLVGDH